MKTISGRLPRGIFILALFTIDLFVFEIARAAPPAVSNIRASQRAGTQLVDILYNLTDPDSATVSIQVMVSADGGTNYNVPVSTLSGAYGAGIPTGVDRHIVWNAGVDWPGRFSDRCRIRVLADDGSSPPVPAGMVYVPAGAFQMGDNFFEGAIDELPVHTVLVSAFFMDKFEVSRELWLDVYSWAIAHGYVFNNAGSFAAAGHPVQSINWYDAIKWCNARSEKEGLTPVYYSDAAQTDVYRSPAADIGNTEVKWTANGYRLPTEAEWEKAARGNLQAKRYPWGDGLDLAFANFSASNDPWEPGTTPVGYYNGSQAQPGPDMANGYGLYDMAGNVQEFCWDRYAQSYYGTTAATQDNPRGPDTGTLRIGRGGNYLANADAMRCARRIGYNPGVAQASIGFRCVRALAP